MKKLIRKSCFETNSSSCHSIALASDDKQFILDTLYPDQNGVIRLTGGEFGWEWFKHNDVETKANYAAQSLGNDETLIEVIKEQTGATDVIIDTEDGYIDHDSYGIVPKDKHGLRNFIFNKNSWLFGGNDNNTPDPTFYHTPEIRDGKIIYPEYKYELCVENFDGSTKFLTNPNDEELIDALCSLLSDRLLYEDGTFVDESISDNILFKITNNVKYLEFDYMGIDLKEKTVLFIKESTRWTIISRLRNDDKFEELDYDEKEKFIRKEIMKDPTLFKKLKFTLKEI